MGEVAFVAGATGYVGREVVRQACAAGVRTVAHVRPDSPRLDDWRARFEPLGAEIDTTAWEAAAMNATFVRLQPTVVYALLGTTRKRGRGTGDSYQSVDFGLTKLLIDAAVAAGCSPRIVYLSSAGVGPGSRSAYMRARFEAENALVGSGLPYTIARPSFITGPDRDDGRPTERAAAAVSDVLLGAAGLAGLRRLRDRYRSTDNVTLAGALVRLAADPAAAGRVLEGAALR
jgi:uncharacterized protein YbjT (DUF2867 family)